MVALGLQAKTQRADISRGLMDIGGLFSLAPFSSCIMQTLFVQTFLFCPKELRGVSSPQAGQALPAEASCAARGHKQLAKSSQPAAGK